MFTSINTSAGIVIRIRVLLELGALFLVGSLLSFCLIWQSAIFSSSSVPQNASEATNVSQEVRSWLSQYHDLSQAPVRDQAFWKLITILQSDEDAAQSIERAVLLQQNDNLEVLAIAVGALSSEGSPKAQQALSDILQAFDSDAQKAITVMPQIMLLEQPQDFLFDELQAFIRKSPNALLQEDAELVLAGLSQRASQMNVSLAQRINSWMNQKKAQLSDDSKNLAHYLDLLGNTANESFLNEILPFLGHEDAEVRERAVFALRLFQNERAASALRQRISIEENPQVKQRAIDALSYLHST